MAYDHRDNRSNSEPKLDVRVELSKLDGLLGELKVQYEQFFLGIISLPPDRLHFSVKQLIKKLKGSPFKSSAMRFQLRSLENRYNSYNTYWQRVLRERENGTYSRDVFKAELRKRLAQEEALSNSAKGQAEKGFVNLYNSYKSAIEQRTGKAVNLDYAAFKKSLLQRSKEFKTQTGAKKLSYTVLVKNGKVTLQVRAKSTSETA